jgi:6-phosphofructokinase 2
MSSIVTITFNPCIDLNTTVPGLMPDHKLRCSIPLTYPGGGGINVSRAIKRIGGESMAIYLAGGSNGKLLARLLQAEGIRSILAETICNTRENLMVVDLSNGKQYRFVLPGPFVEEAAVKNLMEIVAMQKDAEYMVVSGSLPPGLSTKVFEDLARISCKNAIRLIVDSSGEALKQAVVSGVYMIKPSIRELLLLSGLKEDELNADLEALSKELLKRYDCQVVVLSMGASGALLVTNDMVRRIRPPAVKPVSTIGSGDCLLAGIVWKLSQGKGLEEAVTYGCAAGAAATLNPGTQLFKPLDVENLFNSIKKDHYLDENKNYCIL